MKFLLGIFIKIYPENCCRILYENNRKFAQEDASKFVTIARSILNGLKSCRENRKHTLFQIYIYIYIRINPAVGEILAK